MSIEHARFEQGRFGLAVRTIRPGEQVVVLIANNEVQCSFAPGEINDLLAVAEQMARHVSQAREDK